MSKKILLIVESPNKAKTIKELAGADYKVMASAGHIRDLPEKEIGVEAPDYRPKYVITKKDLVKRLREAVPDCSQVILATDPDREGEAIAWHIKQALGLKDCKRVAFQEITKAAIQKALTSPGQINNHLVEAQETRRVLDRLVGYQVSGPISNYVGQRSSAGRVQSVAMRMVVERDLAILNFVSKTYYDVYARFGDPTTWSAKWIFTPFLKDPVSDGETPYWMDRTYAETLGQTVKTLEVLSVEKKNSSKKPPAPFTTSALVQKASTKLGFTTEKTMELAQKLFEGDGSHGYITYHRTDSPNLSDEAIQSIWAFLTSRGMSNAIPDKPNKWKAKGGAQEAHEAIRPTDFNVIKLEGTDPDAEKLYKLIWTQAVGSQMAPAVYDVTTVLLKSQQELDGKYPEFKASGRVLKYSGWLDILKGQSDDNEDEEEDAGPIPEIKKGDILTPDKMEAVEGKTRPPAKYTEASLVKDLEARGIGRPSTYSSIMKVIKKRSYVVEQKKNLVSTPLAQSIYKAMKGRFSFFEIDFTKNVEQILDRIALGEVRYLDVVRMLDGQLLKEIESLEKLPGAKGNSWQAKSLGTCPACGKGEVVESPKAFGCSLYKEGCKFTIWKDAMTRFKKKVTETMVKHLLTTGNVELNGLISPKTEQPFNCYGELVNDPDWGWKINLVFDRK